MKLGVASSGRLQLGFKDFRGIKKFTFKLV